jgi:RNA polymerase sigma factor (sigma-70 family)
VRRAKPERNELFRAAVELVSTASSGFKATARRYSLCPADAEDAYQRGLEILITKAPTGERAELKPWLHTVIKHEALAIRRQRERLLEAGESSPEAGTSPESAGPEARAPERERAQRTAEALSELKAGEIQCLLLKALGYSYDEIAAKTGFSWTKVNRSLTEGRKRFFDRFAQIESGERCGSFRSLLSAAGDGEATAEDQRLLRAHLRSCAGCRAALRDYRTLPARLAELLPPAVLLPGFQKEGWWSRLHDTVAVWTADRGAAIEQKLQQAGEALGAQKATAVVASTAALTGGAVAHERAFPDRGSVGRGHAARPHDRTTPERSTPAPGGAQSKLAPSAPELAAPPARLPTSGTAASQSEPRVPAVSAEFSPESTGPNPATSATPAHAASIPEAKSGNGATSVRAKPRVGSGAGQEFGP